MDCLSPKVRWRFRTALLTIASLLALASFTSNRLHAGEARPELRSGPISPQDRKFWSFQPVVRPPIPAVDNEAWCRTPIDYFVLERLERRGLPTARDADRRTFIRRVTFDLIGLPPTSDEIDAFLSDSAPGALERLVERLLASPHFGERWGRHWLDLVRYADTAGETADYPVPLAWQYRNWVIDALNADKPYDVFLREQLAGDILAQSETGERFKQLVTATGFIAVSRRFGFGIDRTHYLTIQDTIDTLGQTVLGLSPGCARCHDHKYDPINMDDYYAWYGIFESTQYSLTADEKTKTEREFAPLVPSEEAELLDIERKREMTQLTAVVEDLTRQVTEIDKKLADNVPDLRDGDFEQFPIEGEHLTAAPWDIRGGTISVAAQSPYTNVYPTGSRGLRTRNEGGNNGAGCKIAKHTARTHQKLWFNLDFRNVSAKKKQTGANRIYIGQGPGKSPAVEVFLIENRFFIKNGDLEETICQIDMGQWYNLQIELDLARRVFSGTIGHPDRVISFKNKAVRPGWNGEVDVIFVDGYGHGTGVTAIKPEQDFDNMTLRTEALLPVGESVTSAVTAEAGSPALEIRELREKQAKLGTELAKKKERLAHLGRPFYDLAFGAREGQFGDVAIQMRGDPQAPGEIVTRRHFTVFGGDALESPEKSSGRLDLARWLTRPQNPLTARVIVNRIWQYHFGRGLVETPNDFGTRGRLPSHPELLDWLADELVHGNWSMKHLHRLILTSRVYQLSTQPARKLSSENEHQRTQLFGRYQKKRLEAEAVRDSMLALGGELDRSQGKGHPFPAAETWKRYTQHGPFYAVYETKRRSIYLMAQRLKAHPFLGLFDGADPSVSTGRRTETTTPTQTLWLMNNSFVHEQAHSFAESLLRRFPENENNAKARRLQSAFEECFARLPDTRESERSLLFIERYEAGLAESPEQPDNPTHEAWAAFLRTLLTRNEFLFLE